MHLRIRHEGAVLRPFVFLLTLLGAAPAFAHDYWLSPDQAVYAAGDTCRVRMWVGDHLDPEIERPLQKEITTRYLWRTSDSEIDLLSAMADSTFPVLERVLDTDHPALLVMDRDWWVIDSTYEQFRRFLEHEEHDELLAEIESVPGETPMRRRYNRNLKCWLAQGNDGDGLGSAPSGQELELLVQPASGDSVEVRLLFQENPLPGEWVRVFVGRPDGAVDDLKARTLADGRVKFPLAGPGLWVFRVGYLRPSADPAQADWDTHYAVFSWRRP